jgi:hypothetical protein
VANTDNLHNADTSARLKPRFRRRGDHVNRSRSRKIPTRRWAFWSEHSPGLSIRPHHKATTQVQQGA